MSSRTVRVNRRPTTLSSVASVGAATAALWMLVPGTSTQLGLLVEIFGLALLAGGFGAYRRGWHVTGVMGSAGGIALWGGSLVLVRNTLVVPSQMGEVLPGMVGLLALTLGLVPYRGTGSRGLVKLGTALVFVSVLASGFLPDSTLDTLLMTGVATVVAWDAGEHAISVGEQLGRVATTTRLDVVHVVGSVVVGGVAITSGQVVASLGSPRASLTSLGLLLLAVVLLTIAIHE